MKKGILILLLVCLFSLSVILCNNRVKAYSEYDKLFTGYKNITTSNVSPSYVESLKTSLALSTNNTSQNYSYQSLIVWLDNNNVKQYTFYDMCYIQYYQTTSTSYTIEFLIENQVGYSGLSPSLSLTFSYDGNETIAFYYLENGNYTLDNNKLIGFYLADNWEDDRVLNVVKRIFNSSTYDYLTLQTIFNEDLNSNQVDTQFLIEDYDYLVSLTESYLSIIEQQNEEYYQLQIQYENLQNIVNGIGSEQTGVDTFFYNLFNNFKSLFSVQIIPGFTILTFIAIPLMFSLLALCLHILKG